MLIDIIDKLVYELYYAPVYIPFYTLAVIAFWYVIFLALFDIMHLLYDIWTDYIKPLIVKIIRRMILNIYLHYLDLSDRVRFYNDKRGRHKDIKELEEKQNNDIM